ncbi:MAG: bifunctional phosphoribosyl-AMP cyclohydrolase/phosphoribosyl-ATP diphosphatase HisIE [Candidatus Entotheonellia bacterium]
MEELHTLQFNDQGLIPAIVQEAGTGQVLMLAYMNREALTKTLDTGLAHFWSRSRGQLWQKGETSGHIQHVREIRYDCDADALLVLVNQEGAACHTGERSCFFRLFPGSPHLSNPPTSEAILHRLYEVILDRKQSSGRQSYVKSLFERGQDQVLKKVVEEAAEVALASKNGRPEEILYEMADLWFHALVALGWHNLPPEGVFQELQRRFGVSGLRSGQVSPAAGMSEQNA